METAPKKTMTSEDVFFEILAEKFNEYLMASSFREEQRLKAEILEFIKNPGE